MRSHVLYRSQYEWLASDARMAALGLYIFS